MKRFFLFTGHCLRRVEDTMLTLLLALMVILAVWQIVQRNFLGSGLVWIDEFLRILVLWLTMLGAAVASRSDHHICMDLLLRAVAVQWQAHLKRVIYAITAVVCLLLCWAATRFVLSEAEYGSLVLGSYPAWWFQGILPVGFGLISWHYLLLLFWPPHPSEPAAEPTATKDKSCC